MKEIIDILNSSEFYSNDEIIEIAKGKYELPNKPNDWFKKIKRTMIKFFR